MGYYEDEHKYDDIINLPHYQSSNRLHMSLHDRAAQFAPFAALNGHSDAIEETARLTDNEIIIDDTKREEINRILSEISKSIQNKKTITFRVAITYFRPDEMKQGGAYLTDTGIIKKVDIIEHSVIMESGMKIPMEQIVELEYVTDE